MIYRTVRPKQIDAYLVYGRPKDSKNTIDDYSYFIAEQNWNESFTSHCGKELVDIKYVKALF